MCVCVCVCARALYKYSFTLQSIKLFLQIQKQIWLWFGAGLRSSRSTRERMVSRQWWLRPTIPLGMGEDGGFVRPGETASSEGTVSVFDFETDPMKNVMPNKCTYSYDGYFQHPILIIVQGVYKGPVDVRVCSSHTQTHECMHAHVRACTHTWAYVHTQLPHACHTHTHTHAHTHSHTYTTNTYITGDRLVVKRRKKQQISRCNLNKYQKERLLSACFSHMCWWCGD